MTAVISFLVVLSVSLLIVRVAGVALAVTGMSMQAARFEARSAWSGTGFTTAQSEQIVRHPVRRQIVSLLIVLRNAGLVGAASTLFLSITDIQQQGQDAIYDLLILLGGLLALWLISGSRKKIAVIMRDRQEPFAGTPVAFRHCPTRVRPAKSMR